jgi:hypothetical protein
MPLGHPEAVPNFIGGSYQDAPDAMTANSYAVNCWPEFGPGQTGYTVKNSLRPRYGYQVSWRLPGSPSRALFWQDGRGFAVSGSVFCEFFQGGTFTVRGTVAVDDNNATICSGGDNNLQLFIVSGGHGYVFDLALNTLTDITSGDLFPAPALGGAFLQGYALAWQRGSNLLAFSAPNDFTDWTLADGAGQARTQLNSDNISNCVAFGGYLLVAGTKNTEFWQNTGAPDIAFAPLPNAVPAWGLQAPFTLTVLDNVAYGVGINEDGARHVIKWQGYNVSVVSTPAISRILSTVGSLDGATALAYADAGHPFYLLNAPNLRTPDHGTTTFGYDVSTEVWHERGIWDDIQMQFDLDLPRTHCVAWGQHVFGDRQSGALYTFSTGFIDSVILT